MNATATITKVTAWWDDPQSPSVEAGWYCEGWNGTQMICDSQKIWFPVDVDVFDEDQVNELQAALREAFPGATIEITTN
jgi:hypothetical protein